MERTLARDAGNKIGECIALQGFVQTARNQKSVQFIILRDHTGLIQIVAERSEANNPLNELIEKLTRESTIRVTGVVMRNPNVKLGQLELQLQTLSVEAMSDRTLPIDLFGKTETEVDKRLDWRFLDLRQPENQLIFRIQTTVEMAMREFWISNGFVELHTPKIMGSRAKGERNFSRWTILARLPRWHSLRNSISR